jgi:hypothetical protein
MHVSSVIGVVGFALHTVWTGNLWQRWWFVYVEERLKAALDFVDNALLTLELGAQLGVEGLAVVRGGCCWDKKGVDGL